MNFFRNNFQGYSFLKCQCQWIDDGPVHPLLRRLANISECFVMCQYLCHLIYMCMYLFRTFPNSAHIYTIEINGKRNVILCDRRTTTTGSTIIHLHKYTYTYTLTTNVPQGPRNNVYPVYKISPLAFQDMIVKRSVGNRRQGDCRCIFNRAVKHSQVDSLAVGNTNVQRYLRMYVSVWVENRYVCVINYVVQHTLLYILYVSMYIYVCISLCVFESPKYIRYKCSFLLHMLIKY